MCPFCSSSGAVPAVSDTSNNTAGLDLEQSGCWLPFAEDTPEDGNLSTALSDVSATGLTSQLQDSGVQGDVGSESNGHTAWLGGSVSRTAPSMQLSVSLDTEGADVDDVDAAPTPASVWRVCQLEAENEMLLDTLSAVRGGWQSLLYWRCVLL